ncbi:MAG TPA: hypothetical protein VFA43_23415 [Gemmatimonadaceae bacterium]|nr:hypothetical protein [Gemmatimonadaceae bacterium]
MNDNMIDLADADAPIYRIIPVCRFVQLLQSKHLALVRTTKWDDSFENFLLRAEGILDATNERIGLANMHDAMYAQCWTLTPESDAMWRIYSRRYSSGCPGRTAPDTPVDEIGIRIQTTVRKLFESVWDSNDPHRSLAYYIGRVGYVDERRIDDFMRSRLTEVLLLDATGKAQIQTLLVKRTEFEHEQEVRVIVRSEPDSRRLSPDRELYLVPIDPAVMFTDVLIDPRASSAEVASIKAILKAAGFSGTANQSRLYARPSYIIRITA